MFQLYAFVVSTFKFFDSQDLCWNSKNSVVLWVLYKCKADGVRLTLGNEERTVLLWLRAIRLYIVCGTSQPNRCKVDRRRLERWATMSKFLWGNSSWYAYRQLLSSCSFSYIWSFENILHWHLQNNLNGWILPSTPLNQALRQIVIIKNSDNG